MPPLIFTARAASMISKVVYTPCELYNFSVRIYVHK
nr:MAG TPA: hypothetical protein [Caudoviricetes sp.]